MAFSRENTADQGSNLNPIAGYASGYAYMHDESESSQMGPFLQMGSAPGGGLTGGERAHWGGSERARVKREKQRRTRELPSSSTSENIENKRLVSARCAALPPVSRSGCHIQSAHNQVCPKLGAWLRTVTSTGILR